jgi:hypothetical protein
MRTKVFPSGPERTCTRRNGERRVNFNHYKERSSRAPTLQEKAARKI